MKIRYLLTSFFLFLLVNTGFPQTEEHVQYDRILPKKVKKLLHKANMERTADFEKLQDACFGIELFTGCYKHEYNFEIDEKVESVWNIYRKLRPWELGGGKIITFGVCYSRRNKKLIYAGDNDGRIEQGHIIFSGLRYFGGLVKLAVGQVISEIDEAEKSITICYLKNGKTLGSQQIRLVETKEGHTQIVHLTFYKSKSKFRDKKLYPGLHEKTVAELHRNVCSKIVRG